MNPKRNAHPLHYSRHRYPAVYTLFIVLLAVCSIPGCRRTRDVVGFDTLIDRADAFLASGAVHQADIELDRAEERAANREEWFRILKRRYSAAMGAASWEAFAESARVASDRFPGTTEFRVFYTYGALRARDIKTAVSLEREYLRSDEWKPLSDEIWLVGKEYRSDDDRRVALPETYDPSLDVEDARILVQAAERFDEPRFLLDASLVYAGTGSYAEARTALGNLTFQFPAAAALYRYDEGNVAEAFDLIEPFLSDIDFAVAQRDTDEVLMFADIASAAGRGTVATRIYTSLVSARSDHSWIPYANLASYERRAGNYDSAIAVLDAATRAGFDRKELAVERIMTEIELGDAATANRLVLEMDSKYPASYETAVLYYLIEQSAGRAGRAISAVKEAFYRNPMYEHIAYLAVRMLANAGDFAGIRQILDDYLSAAPDGTWTWFFRGYISVHEGRLNDALNSFLRANDAAGSPSTSGAGGPTAGTEAWQYAYNAGIIHSALGEYDEARSELRKALAFATDAETRGDIVLRIAVTFQREGDLDSARRQAAYASEIAPKYTEALLYLRELDAAVPTP